MTAKTFLKNASRVPGASTQLKPIWDRYKQRNPSVSRAEFLSDLGREGYRIGVQYGRQHILDVVVP
jgi:hypothetical protein